MGAATKTRSFGLTLDLGLLALTAVGADWRPALVAVLALCYLVA